ncbi:unnamed protein product, partial [Closterium sp. NIES-53]
MNSVRIFRLQIALIAVLLISPALRDPLLPLEGGGVGGGHVRGWGSSRRMRGPAGGGSKGEWGVGVAVAGATMAAECLEVGRRLQQAMWDIEQRYGVDVVQRSFAFDPPLHRFLVLLAKLLTGRPLTVLAVGGSISAAGHLPGGVMHGTATYGQALLDWLQQVFPTPPSTPPHRLIRAFLPGAGSYVLHFCTGELLGALWTDGEEQRRAAGEADVVLLECAANDWSVLQPGMAPPPGSPPPGRPPQ